jgi:hypothetical protein
LIPSGVSKCYDCSPGSKAQMRRLNHKDLQIALVTPGYRPTLNRATSEYPPSTPRLLTAGGGGKELNETHAHDPSTNPGNSSHSATTPRCSKGTTPTTTPHYSADSSNKLLRGSPLNYSCWYGSLPGPWLQGADMIQGRTAPTQRGSHITPPSDHETNQPR